MSMKSWKRIPALPGDPPALFGDVRYTPSGGSSLLYLSGEFVIPMKSWNKPPALLVALAALFALAATSIAQDQAGPTKDVDQTVAKPRKSTGDPEEAPIPSKLSKKAQPDIPENLPSFKSDVNVVSVDVAVLDKNGHFIPNIPRGSFRVLEDNVPQQIKSFGKSTAPMTVWL